MKRKLFSFVIAAALVFLTACQSAPSGSSVSETGDAGNASNSSVITLEFFQQKNEAAAQKAYQMLVDEFNEQNPDIVVKMVTVPDAPQVLTTRLAADDVPDIFSDFPTDLVFKNRIQGGYYLDLSDQAFIENVSPGLLEMSVAPDGKYYALPYSQNFFSMYYDMDAFEKYGLSVPKTWDQFMDICETLQANGEQPIVHSFKDMSLYMYYSMIMALNPDGIEHMMKVVADTSGATKVSDDEGFRLLGEKLLEMLPYCNSDAFSISYSESLENFANHKGVMIPTGSFARGTIMEINPEINFGVFPFPSVVEGEGNQLAGIDSALCISGKATAERQSASLRFLEYISQPENAQRWSDVEGAPSCIQGTTYGDESTQPVMDLITAGRVHDWPMSFMEARFCDGMNPPVQMLLMDQDIDAYLSGLDEEFESLKD